MKVAFISNSVFDGAGIAAHRIFRSVTSKGIEGRFFSNDRLNKEEFKKLDLQKKKRWWGPILTNYYWKKYQKPALAVKKEFDYFTLFKLDHDTPFSSLGYVPDIIHLHWINNILDFPTFFSSLPKNIPIVWTLHDMSPFTGGCIYSWECRKFENTCNNCPQLPQGNQRFDLALVSQQSKYDLLKDKNLHLVANSKWLHGEAAKSVVFENAKSLRTIHISIDSSLFKPLDKEICRTILGLPNERFVICFGATFLNSKRKGLKELLKALAIVFQKDKNVQCVVYGNNFEPPDGFLLPPFLSLGKIESESILRLVYSAADVFIIPSLEEAFGQTCLEAMSCGTPVLGFDVGGIPDMIQPGVTGWLSHKGDSEDLAERINWMILNSEKRKQMGRNARLLVEEHFSMQKQGDAYVQLYNSVLFQNKLNVL